MSLRYHWRHFLEIVSPVFASSLLDSVSSLGKSTFMNASIRLTACQFYHCQDLELGVDEGRAKGNDREENFSETTLGGSGIHAVHRVSHFDYLGSNFDAPHGTCYP